MHIKTQAVQINERTWPVAVACLGGYFAAIPFPQTNGAYLVINAPQPGFSRRARYAPDAVSSRTITIGNSWISKEDFEHMYTWDKRSNPDKSFVDVTLVNDAPRDAEERPLGYFNKGRDLVFEEDAE